MITEQEVKEQYAKAMELLRESGERVEMKLIFQVFKEEIELSNGKTDKIGGIQYSVPECFKGVINKEAIHPILNSIAWKAVKIALGE